MNNSHLIQFLLDRIYISVFVKECICNDECFLFVHYCSQLVKRYRHTSFLKVNFLRCSKPQHILSPLGNCFHVQKMFYTNVF